MSSITVDKFGELEARIARTIDMVKTMRREKEAAEKELAAMRSRADRLEREMTELKADRDLIKDKVESLLDSLAALTEDALV
ncbi:MAG TPA: cell division protein ZapB [Terriglobia bacterium]|nr:cell division protein ZapB [Terriglobia bacterium]